MHLQLIQEALKEHAQKMRSLSAEVRNAVNVCVGAHFPEYIDEGRDQKPPCESFYGNVFVG